MRDSGLELRLLRTFMAVGQRRNFSRAAEDLNIAQQAVSQQIKALERALGVTLLRRSSRQVELTAEGAALLDGARKVLAAADDAARAVKAVARGEAGTLRLAYTYSAAWETVPKLLSVISERLPRVRVESREVDGGSIAERLLAGQFDLAIAPRTSYPERFHTRVIRRERLGVALSRADRLARRKRIDLSTLAERLFEIWPREVAPGMFDAIVSCCRAAGFEPKIDEQATGNTVWRNIQRGRGVALINTSAIEPAPRNVVFVNVTDPGATVMFDAIWHLDDHPLTRRVVEIASELAKEAGWLSGEAMPLGARS